MKMKIEFVSESILIYPYMYGIEDKLESSINFKGSRKRTNNLDEHFLDLFSSITYNNYKHAQAEMEYTSFAIRKHVNAFFYLCL
jgi:hypothetical protein